MKTHFGWFPFHEFTERPEEKTDQLFFGLKPVLWIRIRMDPELLPQSGSGNEVPDPDPAKSERAYK